MFVRLLAGLALTLLAVCEAEARGWWRQNSIQVSYWGAPFAAPNFREWLKQKTQARHEEEVLDVSVRWMTNATLARYTYSDTTFTLFWGPYLSHVTWTSTVYFKDGLSATHSVPNSGSYTAFGASGGRQFWLTQPLFYITCTAGANVKRGNGWTGWGCHAGVSLSRWLIKNLSLGLYGGLETGTFGFAPSVYLGFSHRFSRSN